MSFDDPSYNSGYNGLIEKLWAAVSVEYIYKAATGKSLFEEVFNFFKSEGRSSGNRVRKSTSDISDENKEPSTGMGSYWV